MAKQAPTHIHYNFTRNPCNTIINKIWLGGSWLCFLLLPLSIVYGMIIGLRRLCYHLSIFPS
ncbi:MAG: hypothetical protein ACTS7E_05195, partial [Arsenophonus sp. NC-CH8-MAG3]